MRIGVPKEIKTDEYRVALTPAGARELIQRGHEVVVETTAGEGSAFPDDQYERAGARIVSVSSSGNLIAPVIFDDLHFNFLPYEPFVAYGQSKTACALLAVEASRRWGADRICANALNPGAIATTAMVKGADADSELVGENLPVGSGVALAVVVRAHRQGHAAAWIEADLGVLDQA